MEKHAYLIMAHGNWEILRLLLQLLDDPRNDIYLHVDKNARTFLPEMVDGCVSRGSLILLPRRKVSWGGYSQVHTELRLMKAAAGLEYGYYHLLSGVDMPLKDQDTIRRFFAENKGREFIGIDETVLPDSETLRRIRYLYPFQDRIGRKPGRVAATLGLLQQKLLRLQEICKTDRTRKYPQQFYKGANWFSITHAMVQQVLAAEKEIRRIYRYGLCVDEIFLQTVAMGSPLGENVTGCCLRHTDWERGKPYTFTEEDYDELVGSSCLFARKFDGSHMQIVQRLYQQLKEKK